MWPHLRAWWDGAGGCGFAAVAALVFLVAGVIRPSVAGEFRLGGTAVELQLRQVSDRTLEIVLAPVRADGRVARPSRPATLVDYESRALWLHHSDDAAAVARDDEYLWGRDLLVAPVVEKGAMWRSVYLPRGTWFDWWTGEALAGGRESVRPVDLATLPLFVRAGAIIPLEPVRQTTDEPANGPLTLLIHAGADGAFTVYDDDGRSLAYQRGEYSRRRYDWDNAGRRLRIHPTVGRYASAAGDREVVVRVREPGGRVVAKELKRVLRDAAISVNFP